MLWAIVVGAENGLVVSKIEISSSRTAFSATGSWITGVTSPDYDDIKAKAEIPTAATIATATITIALFMSFLF